MTAKSAEAEAMPLRGSPITVLYAITAFASACLLFLMEPMVARMVLPTFGGAPMVWNACMVFFQVMLLLGYAYAWGISRWLPPGVQAAVHTTILALAVLTLPSAFDLVAPTPAGWSTLYWLLALLASRIAVPFFALSANAPILQYWFSRTGGRRSADPYFLYAASNLGSFGALLAYPLLVEPMLGLRAQGRSWWVGYGVFLMLAAACAVVVWSRNRRSSARPGTRVIPARGGATPGIGWLRRARWVLLALVPSSLMLSVTMHISADIAAFPLLWVVPLAIYLGTFVVAFGTRGGQWLGVANRALPILVLLVVLFMASQATGPLLLMLPLHLLTFVTAALVCHGQLAADRPEVEHLTEFYFWMALGGMFGGLFNTLVAPSLFTGVAEYPLGLVMACALRPPVESPQRAGRRYRDDLLATAGVFGLSVAAISLVREAGGDARLLVATLAVPTLLSFTRSRRPVSFALAVGAILGAAALVGLPYGRVLRAERTFFGVYRVAVDPAGQYYRLFHGTTLHGMQATDRARRGEALTYYGRTGPFGQAWERVPEMAGSKSVAVVGLGVGSLATYAGHGQRWTFFEIDPAVERIARDTTYFTHLSDCGARCDVILGDARLSLAGVSPHTFDLIVLDAFSSDAIPVHLITREALDLYLSRLKPGGVLAFHISNRHLSLGPVLGRLAVERYLTALEAVRAVSGGEEAEGVSPSNWIVMARDPSELVALAADPGWSPPLVTPATPLWTDDFSNLLSVLSLR